MDSMASMKIRKRILKDDTKTIRKREQVEKKDAEKEKDVFTGEETLDRKLEDWFIVNQEVILTYDMILSMITETNVQMIYQKKFI